MDCTLTFNTCLRFRIFTFSYGNFHLATAPLVIGKVVLCQVMIERVLHSVICVYLCVCEFGTWLVCSQYLKRGSLTLGITSLYTMCSAIVVSRDKATPTQSITNRPEKCFIPICSVWRDMELVSGVTGYKKGKKKKEVEDKISGMLIYCF